MKHARNFLSKQKRDSTYKMNTSIFCDNIRFNKSKLNIITGKVVALEFNLKNGVINSIQWA